MIEIMLSTFNLTLTLFWFNKELINKAFIQELNKKSLTSKYLNFYEHVLKF